MPLLGSLCVKILPRVSTMMVFLSLFTCRDQLIVIVVSFLPCFSPSFLYPFVSRFSISQITTDSVIISTADKVTHQFTFDRVFGTNSEQDTVWKYTGEPMVNAVLQGFNSAILAYGQTGAGKTHTMMGPEGNVDVDPSELGIIPRAVKTLFERMENADEGTEFTMVVSYVEIYQEKIRDLLDVSKDDLKIGELQSTLNNNTTHSTVYIKEATEFSVASAGEVFDIMRAGANNRATAATGMNAGSSRSHALFMLTVTQENMTTGIKTTGKLYLVDLAGSETVSKTGVSGVQLEELKRINKSLSALGGVINALTDGKSQHIPYRDSKLTRLLQDCLGGNSKTALVINCSPATWNEMETLSTLRFGKRAKSIQNKPLINVERSPEELKRIVTTLEAKIMEYNRREKEWLRAYRSSSFPTVLIDALAHIATAAEGELSVNDRTFLDSNPLLLPSTAHPLVPSKYVDPPPVPVNSSRTVPASTVSSTSSVPGSSQKVLEVDEGIIQDADANTGQNDAPEIEETDGSWEESYDDLLASRDLLENQNKSLLELLKETSTEMKKVRQSIEVRDQKVQELQDRAEKAENALSILSTNSSSSSSIVSNDPTSTRDELRTVQENYQHALQENEELRNEVNELRIKLAETEANTSLDDTSSSVVTDEPVQVTNDILLPEKSSSSLSVHSNGLLMNSNILTVNEEVWENQRLYPVTGWSSTLLPADPPSWSDTIGLLPRTKDSVRLPPSDSTIHWYWSSGWNITIPNENTLPNGTDREGWQYGNEFPELCTLTENNSPSTLSNERTISRGICSRNDTVRRRCWVRTRTCIPLDIFTKSNSSLNGTDNTKDMVINPLLNRVQNQDETINRLQHETNKKQDLIIEYETRISTLTRQLADATAAATAATIIANKNVTNGNDPLSIQENAAASRIISSNNGTVPVRIRGGAGRHSNAISPSSGANMLPSTSSFIVRDESTNNTGTNTSNDLSSSGFFRGLLKRLSTSPSKAGTVPPESLNSSSSNDRRSNNDASKDGKSALAAQFFKACEEGDLNFVKDIVNKGTLHVSITDRSNRTGILYAGRGGQLPIVQLLVRAGCPLGACDKDARNALAYAARRGHVEVASWLLSQGVSVNSCDVHGLSPLHQAVLGRHTAVAELLLKAGADLRAKDSNGNTPYRLAKRFLTDESADSRAVLLCLQRWLKALSSEDQLSAGRDNASVTSHDNDTNE